MTFTKSRSLDFQPKIFVDKKLLDVVESQKLLGVMISSDLKWTTHVNHIKKKFMTKLWMLRRVKEMGGSIEDLKTVYIKQLRCLTEKDCPLWNGALTKTNISHIEKLQKTAFRLILGSNYRGYQNSLATLNLASLIDRRVKICTKFANKTQRNPKYSAWFTKSTVKTRFSKQFFEYDARTERYRRSPIYYLTSLLNN